MYDEGEALRWLVRALARHPDGRAELSELSGPAAPLPPEDLAALVRRAAAMGLVIYQGPDTEGRTIAWLTTQGEQALGMLQRYDDEE